MADDLGCEADDGGGLVDQVSVAAERDRAAAQRLRDPGRAGLAAPAGQRLACRDAFVQPGPQPDRQVAVDVRLGRCRRRGPPVAVRGEDVDGELVDEAHGPDEQRPQHFFGDPGGGVLAAMGLGFAPAVDVARVEAQNVRGQDASPDPELARGRAGSLPGVSGGQGLDQESLEVLHVLAGHRVEASGAGCCPAQEPDVLGEGGADGGDLGPVLARRDGPRQHLVAEFLGDLPVRG
ncbi:hypothetical protein AB0D57_45490 [Streptomyces sp. NPDC048275]|uniref:hypothetical protein n=1 Tax=Streptomyces sp. NPDC048275 TaxID=3155629 RepID=UPI0033F1D2BF